MAELHIVGEISGGVTDRLSRPFSCSCTHPCFSRSEKERARLWLSPSFAWISRGCLPKRRDAAVERACSESLHLC